MTSVHIKSNAPSSFCHKVTSSISLLHKWRRLIEEVTLLLVSIHCEMSL